MLHIKSQPRNFRKIRLLSLVVLLLLTLGLSGCQFGEYKDQIETINAAVETLGTVQNGHITVTTQVAAENGLVSAYDSAYVADYRYRIDIKTFNFIVEKHDLATGKLLEAPYKVVDAHKYDVETGVEDEEYSGKIGDFPDLLSFFFGAGLKSGFVGTVESLTDDEHPTWQGYRVHKNEKYVSRVNSSRGKDGGDGTMLENYVDYWIDDAGVLVRMDYVSRDDVVYEDVEDVINQSYVFELVGYNDPEIADF
jgi:hypothetical protein